MSVINSVEIQLYNNDELIDNTYFINSLIYNDSFWNSTETFQATQICEKILITLINNDYPFNKIVIKHSGNDEIFKKNNDKTYEYEWKYNDKTKFKRTNIINCNCFKDAYEVYIYDLITNDYNLGEHYIKYLNNHLNNNDNFYNKKLEKKFNCIK